MKSILSLLCLALAFSSPAAGSEKPAKQKSDEFLLAWVKGTAKFEFQAEFHESYPRSPHKPDSEHFEVAWRCLYLRDECGQDRADSLAAEMVKLHDADDATEDRRARVLRVLGRLQAPAAVPLLCRTARTGTGEVRREAIRSLAFFGHVTAKETFCVFGGKIWSVVLRPAPSEEATKTLLAILGDLREAPPASIRGRERRERAARIHAVRSAVLAALESHRGAAVAAAALEALRKDEGTDLVLASTRVGDLIVCNLEHVARDDLLALLKDERASVRRATAGVLGWTADPGAVSPLLALLDDEDVRIRRVAHASLSRLAGVRPDLLGDSPTTLAEWAKRLGRNGEHLDPTKSLRHVDGRPGVYRLRP